MMQFMKSNTPAIVLPGIHDESNVDSRMKFFSHGASPEKIGLAYYISKYYKSRDFILCDVSSNTVSLAVAESRIVGAIDAAIFAPGVAQGPLDLQAIRDVDNGLMTANEAFSSGGLVKRGLGEHDPDRNAGTVCGDGDQRTAGLIARLFSTGIDIFGRVCSC